MFLRRGFFAGLAGVLAALGAGIVAFLWPRRAAATEYDAGEADSFALGEVRHFQVGGGAELPLVHGTRALRDFHLVRREDGFVAFWHRCTHMGCAVPFRPEMTHAVAPGQVGLFRCPCHGSTYSKEEGAIVFGPAPRALDALPVRVEKGRVVVTVREGAEKQRPANEAAPVARWVE